MVVCIWGGCKFVQVHDRVQVNDWYPYHEDKVTSMDDWFHGQESEIMPNIAMGILRPWKILWAAVYLSARAPISGASDQYGWGQFSCDVDFEVFLNSASVSMHLA